MARRMSWLQTPTPPQRDAPPQPEEEVEEEDYDRAPQELSLCTDERGFNVWLHIYDVGPISSFLNTCIGRATKLGAYHCGVEVLGIEWSFQTLEDCWDDDGITGLTACEPKSHPAHVYSESMCLGRTSLTTQRIGDLLTTMAEEWPANSYHITRRNCVDFAQMLVIRLDVPQEFPDWINGLAKNTLESDTFGPIADNLWDNLVSGLKKQLADRREQEAQMAGQALAQVQVASGRDTPKRETPRHDTFDSNGILPWRVQPSTQPAEPLSSTWDTKLQNEAHDLGWGGKREKPADTPGPSWQRPQWEAAGKSSSSACGAFPPPPSQLGLDDSNNGRHPDKERGKGKDRGQASNGKNRGSR